MKVLAIIVLIYAISWTSFIKKESKYKGNEEHFIGIIYKIKRNDNKLTLYIKTPEKLVINYYDEINDTVFSLGDTIEVKGILSRPNNNTVPNLFNYQKYLYNLDIYYIVTASNIKKIANNTKLIYHIKEKINKRIDNIGFSSEYIKTFVLGDTSDMDDSVMESYRTNGVSHLFSISGMHISLFATIIFLFLKKISYNNLYNYGVVIVSLLFYAFLIGSSASLFRSITMYILFAINKVFNFKIKKIDIMALVLIISLLYRVEFIYDISFQYSYLISFSLVLYGSRFKKIKKKILKSLMTSLISFLVSFPICIYNFYQVNFLSIILNLFFIPLVSIVIFPLSLITFIIPKMSFFLNIFINIMQGVSLFISRNNLGVISFSKPSLLFIIIYYIFLILFLYNKKNIYIFLLILVFRGQIYFNSELEVTYLDVFQGDSTLVRFPHNKGNILIDTGGIRNSDWQITDNRTIPYLKSIGILKIDFLILTHGDYDHMGEAINLVNNFRVDKVIFNCGEFNELEQELIKVLDDKKIPYYSCISKLNIDDNKLYFLNNKDYDNENDNSSVIYTELNNYKFLFMGDAGIEVEQDLIEKYNLQDIDVLKVGHHGSKTSSSKNFIDSINPKYSIISVGENNRYGHPNNSVLNNLKDSKIYRTDQDGSIIFKIKNDMIKIETCAP